MAAASRLHVFMGGGSVFRNAEGWIFFCNFFAKHRSGHTKKVKNNQTLFTKKISMILVNYSFDKIVLFWKVESEIDG